MGNHKGRFFPGEGHLRGGVQKSGQGHVPMSNWRGPISTPQASGGQACSAIPQAARKERQSLPSSSMASVSRCCISSACKCWMEWTCSIQWDSAFLISAVQQAFASIIIEVQLASASIMIEAQLASASLI